MGHAPLAQFSSTSADLVYALNENGKIAHISEVTTGAACRCLCPSCGLQVIAKNGPRKPTSSGKIIAQFFAHRGNGTCKGAAETALHYLAKEIVEEKLQLFIPEVTASYETERRQLHKASLVNFTRATSEAPDFKEVIPDVRVERDDRVLLIEIFVTHACDDKKIQILREKGIATVEVDLSKLSRSSSRSEVELAVLHDAPRKWVFHPKIEAAIAEMKAEALKRKAEAKARFEKLVEDSAAEYASGCGELARREKPELNSKDEIVRAGLSAYVGTEVDGSGCFTVTSAEWQYLILKWGFVPQDDDPPTHRIKALFEWLKDRKVIRKGFHYVAPKVEKALEGKGIGFLSPYHAIKKYLDWLVQRGVLVGDQSYRLSSSSMEAFRSIRKRDARRKQRTENLEARVEKILAILPLEERGALTAADWFLVPQDQGLSFERAIQEDDPQFDTMLAPLARIEAMIFLKGPVVDAFLCLPIEHESQRQKLDREKEAVELAQRRRDAEELAKEGRLRCLKDAAAALGDDGSTWISVPHSRLDGRCPVDMAESGDTALARALSVLNAEVAKVQKKAEEQRRQQELQLRLQTEVESILGIAARPFLGSPYKQLGNAKPRDYCTSLKRLEECVVLAQAVKRELR